MSSDWKKQWIDAVSPEEPQKLSRRMNWDELDDALFQRQLQDSQQQSEIEESAWSSCLAKCQQALKEAWDWPLVPVEPNADQKPFEDLWHPIRCLAINQLNQDLISTETFRQHVLDQLGSNLLSRLCSIGEQVLWECFNNERNPGTMLLAHLGSKGDGSGPPVRTGYETFIRKHRKDGLKQLLGEFPELGRFIGTVVLLWRQSNKDMLNRIDHDREVLEQTFKIPQHLQLNNVQQGLSDPHRGGRAVAVLEFSVDNEPGTKVVYKPKDMAVDAAYQQVLQDLNENSDAPPLQQLAIQTRDGYGYMNTCPIVLPATDQN